MNDILATDEWGGTTEFNIPTPQEERRFISHDADPLQWMEVLFTQGVYKALAGQVIEVMRGPSGVVDHVMVRIQHHQGPAVKTTLDNLLHLQYVENCIDRPQRPLIRQPIEPDGKLSGSWPPPYSR